MLKKRKIGGRRRQVKVTFDIGDVHADSVHVLGDFNNWQPVTPMQRENGSWSTTLTLDGGREYQFRYLLDGDRWMTDPQADRYVANEHGSENAVVMT